jgi:hypothetical protein
MFYSHIVSFRGLNMTGDTVYENNFVFVSDITFPCQINVTSLKAFSLFNYGSILTSWPIYVEGGGGGGGGGFCFVWTEGQ